MILELEIGILEEYVRKYLKDNDINMSDFIFTFELDWENSNQTINGAHRLGELAVLRVPIKSKIEFNIEADISVGSDKLFLKNNFLELQIPLSKVVVNNKTENQKVGAELTKYLTVLRHELNLIVEAYRSANR